MRMQRCADRAASGVCGVEREHICNKVCGVLPRDAASTPHPAHCPPDGRALGSVPTLTSGQAPDWEEVTLGGSDFPKLDH